MKISLSLITKVIYITLAIVAVIAIAFISFNAYTKYKAGEGIIWSTLDSDPELKANQQYVSGDKDAELSGKLFLSLAPNNDDSIIISPFMFDFERERIVYTELDKYGEGESDYGITRDIMFSPDGKWAAFNGVSAADVQLGGWDSSSPTAYQMYLSPVKNATASDKDKFQEIKDNAKRVSFVSGKAKTLTGVNNNGEILMHSLDNYPGDQNHIRPAEEYTIRLISSMGETVIGNGTYPKWITNDLIVYFKNDGVYCKILSTGLEQMLIPYDSNVSIQINSKMGVSKDGKLLAVSIPDAKRLHIFDIDVTSNVSIISPKVDFDATGFWPVFSPDNKFIALQEVDLNAFTPMKIAIADPKPSLSIWRLDDLSKVEYSIDLRDFYQTHIFVSDWVK